MANELDDLLWLCATSLGVHTLAAWSRDDMTLVPSAIGTAIDLPVIGTSTDFATRLTGGGPVAIEAGADAIENLLAVARLRSAVGYQEGGRLSGFVACSNHTVSDEPVPAANLSRVAEIVRNSLNQRKAARAMEREMESAREIQSSLLPTGFPQLFGLDFGVNYRPLFSVGGDYYDVIQLTHDAIAVIVADVAGKGISAAIMMANLRASLRNALRHGTSDLGSLMSHLNRVAHDATPENRYITLFFSQIDSSGRIQYVNAGHNPPQLCTRLGNIDTFVDLAASGPPLGLFPNSHYKQGTFRLGPRDLLVAYTDGVTEARNRSGDEWSIESLRRAILARKAFDTAQTVVDSIAKDLDAFSAGEPAVDDITIVALSPLRR